MALPLPRSSGILHIGVSAPSWLPLAHCKLYMLMMGDMIVLRVKSRFFDVRTLLFKSLGSLDHLASFLSLHFLICEMVKEVV